MASINIDPPVSTPAHEWAAETTGALSNTSSAKTSQTPNSMTTSALDYDSPSAVSTPGTEFPGAFPNELRSQQQSNAPEERTPRAAADHLADAAPSKSVQETSGGYLPNMGVQRAVDAAKAYLPESVVGAVGSVLPASMTNSTNETQTKRAIDPTSGAQATSADRVSLGSVNIDNASNTALPPSTRSESFASGTSVGTRTPSAGPNADVAKNLDATSTAKPTTPTYESAGAPISSSLGTSDAPVPGADSKPTSTPINSANTAIAMHALPTPPASKGSSQTDSKKTLPEPSGLSSRKNEDTSAPAPPPKYELGNKGTPAFNATPAQEHVKSGTKVGAHMPGTALTGGYDASPPASPKSELSDAQMPATTGNHTKNEATGLSDDEEVDGKKEGRVKRAVNKVKDKITNRGH